MIDYPIPFESIQGQLQQTDCGGFSLFILGRQSSGKRTSMSRSNCFILLEAPCDDAKPDDNLLVQPFATPD